ncbi:transcription antitermination protein RfaH [Rubritalea halochordaticola]|uniref:Transcription termination/antitermination protein NusG n=2 Tax=Rubritalea halochordaticola TaxID=714537 RepID=A0ABP9V7S7_9BACT
MSVERSELKWYAVRSQTKRERLAACTLRETLNIPVLAPVVKFQKATRRGKIWWSEAMFPGYLFAKFDPEVLGRQVGYAQGVLSMVKFGQVVPPVPDSFISALLEELGDSEEIRLQHQVDVGGSYEIVSGPLSGIQGEVIEVLPGKERVSLLIELLGQSQRVDLNLYSLLLPGRPSEMGH